MNTFNPHPFACQSAGNLEPQHFSLTKIENLQNHHSGHGTGHFLWAQTIFKQTLSFGSLHFKVLWSLKVTKQSKHLLKSSTQWRGKSNLILDQYLQVVSGNCHSGRILAHTIPFHSAFVWCKSGITFPVLDYRERKEALALFILCSIWI